MNAGVNKLPTAPVDDVVVVEREVVVVGDGTVTNGAVYVIMPSSTYVA